MRQVTKKDYQFASFDAYASLSASIGDLTLPGCIRLIMMKTRDILENLLIVDGVL